MKWSGGGSNSRPLHCERSALPTELPPQTLSSTLCHSSAFGKPPRFSGLHKLPPSFRTARCFARVCKNPAGAHTPEISQPVAATQMAQVEVRGFPKSAFRGVPPVRRGMGRGGIGVQSAFSSLPILAIPSPFNTTPKWVAPFGTPLRAQSACYVSDRVPADSTVSDAVCQKERILATRHTPHATWQAALLPFGFIPQHCGAPRKNPVWPSTSGARRPRPGCFNLSP